MECLRSPICGDTGNLIVGGKKFKAKYYVQSLHNGNLSNTPASSSPSPTVPDTTESSQGRTTMWYIVGYFCEKENGWIIALEVVSGASLDGWWILAEGLFDTNQGQYGSAVPAFSLHTWMKTHPMWGTCRDRDSDRETKHRGHLGTDVRSTCDRGSALLV